MSFLILGTMIEDLTADRQGLLSQCLHLEHELRGLPSAPRLAPERQVLFIAYASSPETSELTSHGKEEGAGRDQERQAD